MGSSECCRIIIGHALCNDHGLIKICRTCNGLVCSIPIRIGGIFSTQSTRSGGCGRSSCIAGGSRCIYNTSAILRCIKFFCISKCSLCRLCTVCCSCLYHNLCICDFSFSNHHSCTVCKFFYRTIIHTIRSLCCMFQCQCNRGRLRVKRASFCQRRFHRRLLFRNFHVTPLSVCIQLRRSVCPVHTRLACARNLIGTVCKQYFGTCPSIRKVVSIYSLSQAVHLSSRPGRIIHTLADVCVAVYGVSPA